MPDQRVYKLFSSDDRYWYTYSMTCPSCDELILYIEQHSVCDNRGQPSGTCLQSYLGWPRIGARRRAPSGVPDEFAHDYNEACLVLDLSCKAAAALGRRCLQNVLRSVREFRGRTLYDEIENVLSAAELPSYIAEDLHFLREVGNLAAHATNDSATGELVDVEPGEAEAVLEVLLSLFDFYFVAPAESRARRQNLSRKLGRTESE